MKICGHVNCGVVGVFWKKYWTNTLLIPFLHICWAYVQKTKVSNKHRIVIQVIYRVNVMCQTINCQRAVLLTDTVFLCNFDSLSSWSHFTWNNSVNIIDNYHIFTKYNSRKFTEYDTMEQFISFSFYKYRYKITCIVIQNSWLRRGKIIKLTLELWYNDVFFLIGCNNLHRLPRENVCDRCNSYIFC